MHESERLLVITHSVAMPIRRDEIERAISTADRETGWDLVEIAPEKMALADAHKIDWKAVETKQEQQIVERLVPAISNRRRIAYFGFAPIPLAIHLGQRLFGYKIEMYQRNHATHEWSWQSEENAPMTPVMRPLFKWDHGSADAGEIVLRVSISHQIAPVSTADVVRNPMAVMDVSVVEPSLDSLGSKRAFNEALVTVQRALMDLHRHFPKASAIHLFIAGPVGLAFQIGALINPTTYPKVVTYQYFAQASPQYRQAIVLGGQTVAGELVSGVKHVDEARSAQPSSFAWTSKKELITGKQPTFLEMSFLHEGLKAARSVVRVNVWNHERKAAQGTGFLIANDRILTNHHVLFDGDNAVSKVLIWFNYEQDAQRRQRPVDQYDGIVATIVGDAKHDWAAIQLATPLREEYEPLNLRPSKPVLEDDFVYIVQHPGGGPKKLAILHNQVVWVTEDVVQYLTDTLPGSSGAPVFNEEWQVIALHREGLEGRADEKNPVKNQGTHIDRVVEGLRMRGILQ